MQRRRTVVGSVLLGLGLLVVALVVWGAFAALSLRSHATTASTRVREVRSALEQGDDAAALRAARAAAEETGAAADAADALPLRLGSLLPVGGRTLRDLRTVVGATDTAVAQGAVPLVEVAGTVRDPEELLLPDGRLDVQRLSQAAERVSPASDALDRAQAQVAGIDPASFPAPLQDGVRSAVEGIDALARQAGTADAALSLLPAALGAQGPRSYLVAFQNPAEARPTGGIVGTWALVTVEDGRARLDETGSNDDLARLHGPVRDLGPEVAELYGSDLALSQNVNLSPHFPHAGQLLSDLWSAQGRPAPDGVIAVDPQGMAPLLAGAGTIDVPGGPSVRADTVVDVLLRQAYEDFAADNDARKQYLSTLVGTVFAGALDGGAFNAATVRGLAEAAREGHVLAWSPRRDEEAALVRTGMAGALPEPAPSAAGVYVTNIDASKLDYYLTEAVTTAPACGDRPATLAVTLGNEAPDRVPHYVSNKQRGKDDTTHTVLLALYLPPQRGIDQVRVGDAPVELRAGTEQGWSVARVSVDVPRGQEVTVTADLTGDPSALTDVHTQALVHAPEVTSASC